MKDTFERIKLRHGQNILSDIVYDIESEDCL